MSLNPKVVTHNSGTLLIGLRVYVKFVNNLTPPPSPPPHPAEWPQQRYVLLRRTLISIGNFRW